MNDPFKVEVALMIPHDFEQLYRVSVTNTDHAERRVKHITSSFLQRCVDAWRTSHDRIAMQRHLCLMNHESVRNAGEANCTCQPRSVWTWPRTQLPGMRHA